MFAVLGHIPDQVPRMLSAIARTDYLSGNRTFQDIVLGSIQAIFDTNPAIVPYVTGFSLRLSL